MTAKTFGLPRLLNDGLVLRWATAEDIDQLAEFNGFIHETPDNRTNIISQWVRDLTSGQHPTTQVNDFTVVVDTKDNHKIVSSLCTIHQTWAYEGVEFPAGRPELVGTLEEYRHKGLVRLQMDAVHAKGGARGELMQGITGIPWYYKQFEYAMSLDLGGGRNYYWDRPGNLVHLPDDEEQYTWRTVKEADIPFLDQIYRWQCSHSLIYTVRNEATWRHEINGHHENSAQFRHRWIIQSKEEGDVGYVQFSIWEPAIVIHEVGVIFGHSLRAVCLYLTRMFKGLAKVRADKHKEKPLINHLTFNLGIDHPVYQALSHQLEQIHRPYAWYIRIPDLLTFVRKIQPVLENRLHQSVMAGHTGQLRLNFYKRGTLQFTFNKGKISDVGTYQKKEVADGDAHFPELLFYHVLCGRQSLAELNQVHADCYGKAEADVLLSILFPKKASLNLGLG